MIGVVRVFAAFAVVDVARDAAIGIPYGIGATIFVRGSFRLVCRRRRPKDEVVS